MEELVNICIDYLRYENEECTGMCLIIEQVNKSFRFVSLLRK